MEVHGPNGARRLVSFPGDTGERWVTSCNIASELIRKAISGLELKLWILLGADTSHLNAIHRGSVINGSDVCSHKWLNNLINRLNYHQWYAEYDLPEDDEKQREGDEKQCEGSEKSDQKSSEDKRTSQAHTCRIFLRKKTIFFSFNVFEMRLNVKQIGATIVHLKFKANLFGFHAVDAVFIQSIQPLEPFKHKITHHFHSADGLFKRLLSKLFLYGEASMVGPIR